MRYRTLVPLLLALALAAASLVALPVRAAPVTLAQWTFNSNPSDGNTATGVTTPASGAGTLALVGSTTSNFFGGNGGGTDNSGFNTSSYPAQSMANKSAGVQFNVSTASYGGIIMSFDRRASGSAANTLVVQYSTDGTTFVDFQTITIATATVFASIVVDFTTVPALADKPNAAFRIVTDFGNGTQYLGTAAGTAAGYSTAGTLRYDNVKFEATTTPTPVALTSFGAREQGGIALEWTTASEIGVQGFQVLRSNTASRADGRLVSDALIAAGGDGPTGASYRWSDATALPATAYHYWLAVIYQNGAAEEYGPLEVGKPHRNVPTHQRFLPLIQR